MRTVCAALLAFCTAMPLIAQENDAFPRPAELEPAIRFWTRVYTEVDTKSGFVHDSRYLEVVYETLRFDADDTRRQRSRQIERAFDRYRAMLEKLASGERRNLSREERRVLELWPENVSNGELRAASERLRFQLGQADRFRAGLIRAGAWKPYIYEVLAERGLPRELAALPHVESSFDPTAYSRVGAAGMWQFTRSTGLRYMRIDHVVDERRDPFFSTHAAARLLEDNYAVLQSWPLAITAYNHGAAGMRRAVSQLGTSDIATIIRDYRGRTFGFASRNFYLAFLAALDVDANAEKYFGRLPVHPPADLRIVTAPDYLSVDTIARTLQLDPDTLRALNPALMAPVWSGDKLVPKGFTLRLPAGPADPEVLLASIPSTERYVAQMPDVYHRVRQGDTLSQIASQYGVSVSSLMALNGLRSRDFIRAGQLLTLPLAASGSPATLAQASGEEVPDDGVYIVRAGDSIERISRRFGVDPNDLLARNGIRDRNRIYVGQTLRIAPAEAVAASIAAVEPELEELLASAEHAVTPAAEEEPFADETMIPVAETEDAGASAQDSEDSTADASLDSEANVLASVQADLAADPSDYSVAADGTIEVQALETLGHYADWLEIRTQRLRDINRIPFDRAVVIGQRLKLEFSRVQAAEFERRRAAYQQSMQEAFFRSYRIADIQNHVVRSGESLWVLAQRRYRVPVWLLRQYNPDLNLHDVRPGTIVKFPRLRPIGEAQDGEEVSA